MHHARVIGSLVGTLALLAVAPARADEHHHHHYHRHAHYDDHHREHPYGRGGGPNYVVSPPSWGYGRHLPQPYAAQPHYALPSYYYEVLPWDRSGWTGYRRGRWWGQ